MKNLRYKIVVQARVGSTRLPFKMLKIFNSDKNLFQIVLENLLLKFSHEDIIVATTDKKNDDPIENIASSYSIEVFRGSENDVLSRYLRVAESHRLDFIIRVCADNPFLQNSKIEELLNSYTKEADYEAFFFKDGTPSILSHSGFFAEAVSTKALKKIDRISNDKIDKEHVTRFIYNNMNVFNVKKHSIEKEDDVKKIRLSIDTADDFSLCSKIFNENGYCEIDYLLNVLTDEELAKMEVLIYTNNK